MTDSTPAPSPQLVEDVTAKPDETLAMLVGTINAIPGMEVGVTLYASGQIVSGLIVGGRVYFEKIAEQLDGKGPIGEALSGMYRNVAEQYRADEREVRGEPGDEDEPPQIGYIHLRAATVHSPGLGAPLEQGLWRGRLSAVSGWSLGNFGSKPAES